MIYYDFKTGLSFRMNKHFAIRQLQFKKIQSIIDPQNNNIDKTMYAQLSYAQLSILLVNFRFDTFSNNTYAGLL